MSKMVDLNYMQKSELLLKKIKSQCIEFICSIIFNTKKNTQQNIQLSNVKWWKQVNQYFLLWLVCEWNRFFVKIRYAAKQQELEDEEEERQFKKKRKIAEVREKHFVKLSDGKILSLNDKLIWLLNKMK